MDHQSLIFVKAVGRHFKNVSEESVLHYSARIWHSLTRALVEFQCHDELVIRKSINVGSPAKTRLSNSTFRLTAWVIQVFAHSFAFRSLLTPPGSPLRSLVHKWTKLIKTLFSMKCMCFIFTTSPFLISQFENDFCPWFFWTFLPRVFSGSFSLPPACSGTQKLIEKVYIQKTIFGFPGRSFA